MQGQTEEVEARAEIFPSPAPSGKLNRVTRYHKGLKGRGEGEKKSIQTGPQKAEGEWPWWP